MAFCVTIIFLRPISPYELNKNKISQTPCDIQNAKKQPTLDMISPHNNNSNDNNNNNNKLEKEAESSLFAANYYMKRIRTHLNNKKHEECQQLYSKLKSVMDKQLNDIKFNTISTVQQMRIQLSQFELEFHQILEQRRCTAVFTRGQSVLSKCSIMFTIS